MQEILIDRGEFVEQHLVEMADDFFIAFHAATSDLFERTSL
jgi:hypothetical protein